MINRKHFYLLSFVLLPLSLWANVVTGVAAIPAGYYSGVDGKNSADAILDALFSRIKNHNVIAYKNLEPYYQQTDFYNDTLWDMYSTCRFDASDANKSQNTVCDAWNKEHSIPQSWFNERNPMKSDLFHVYPTDARVNNFRSNYPYGEVSGKNGAGFPDNYQNHGLGKLGSNTFSGYSGKVFEPADEFKGDLARTYFYMVARYRDQALNASNGSAVFTSSKTNLTTYAQNLFLKWHRNDPVSQKEIDRNQAVYGIQHNRNPFIDYPELVEYIWGDKKGQAVNLAALTPTSKVEEGGDEPPVIIETKYGVMWLVNNTVVRIDSVKAGERVTSLPEAPESCSPTSTMYMGWTATSIDGMTDKEPADLFATTVGAPKIYKNTRFYAVFARYGNMPEVPVTETASFESGYKRGASVQSAKAGMINIAFSQAKYYSELRCYAGSTITLTGAPLTKVVFGQGKNDNANELKADKGKMVDNFTWESTGTGVVFTVDGENGFRGFSSITVTYLVDASEDVDDEVPPYFVDYMTSCGDVPEPEEGIETLTANPSPLTVKKILIDGQLYIVIDDMIYNSIGQRIR